ncbi:hypothetical protein GCM10009679_28290 [Saccharothrix algeriensis]|uniref:Uncharacterized protein n=1 Tax=Catellatospora bangladeshensis TaxID=310355 RepID=A0A8J3JLP6_9ACTN|nr:hypothetical protein Cba03nite_41860 [Catellatospora bangladeshensis]
MDGPIPAHSGHGGRQRWSGGSAKPGLPDDTGHVVGPSTDRAAGGTTEVPPAARAGPITQV